VALYRQQLSLTQQELAERTGLSERTIRDLESSRGRRVPRPGSVRLLADAFGLSGVERDRFCRQASSGGPQAAPQAPAQLPPDVAGFVGRDAELARLHALLAPSDGTAPRIAAVSGTAGVGKTAVALHWAHLTRNRFPDGQLYVNLRGYDADEPVHAGVALSQFLDALGVTGRDIPIGIPERTARYRTELAERRMLIVLDNAATVEQVRPLLPGTGSCAVVVTSRDQLAGLVAMHGAERIDLDLLSPADAAVLLRRLVGARVDADPGAAAALAEQCARLPLALRVAAELAAARPAATIADLVAELADHHRRLNLLDAGGDPRAAVPAVFSWSVRHLPPDVAACFARLGLHPGLDFDAYAAAALAGSDLTVARHALDVLARAHLTHATGAGRYGMHDLLRAYASSLAAEAPADADAATDRLCDYYLGTASAAMAIRFPAESHRRPAVQQPQSPVPPIDEPEAADAWLDRERANLVAIAGHAASHGRPAHAIRLSSTLFRYLAGRPYLDALAIHGHACDAARRTGDRVGHAEALLGVGTVQWLLGRNEEASGHLSAALALYRQAEDRIGEARACTNLGIVEVATGRYDEATEHLRRAVMLFGHLGDGVGEAHALSNLAVVDGRQGRHRKSGEHLCRALTLYRLAGDREGEAHALNSTGLVEARLSRYGQAVEQHERALALYRRLGNPRGEAWALTSLGTAFTRLGHLTRAAKQHQRALELYCDIGERAGEAAVHNALGETARAAGRNDDAAAHHVAALGITEEIDDPFHRAHAHAGLGHSYRALGDPTRARRHFKAALPLFVRLDVPEAETVRALLDALPIASDQRSAALERSTLARRTPS
jgi:tetratricopeptide (TPR) repeat protein/transcriptional regulator with XRE-family HTH domain